MRLAQCWVQYFWRFCQKLKNWPENFFGNEMADLTARTVAAMEQQQKEKAK